MLYLLEVAACWELRMFQHRLQHVTIQVECACSGKVKIDSQPVALFIS